MYYTYIIRCGDRSLYTGICRNMFRRMAEHTGHKKNCAKYTRAREVVSLEALWSSDDRSAAAKLEQFIKTLTRPQKESLIQTPSLLLKKYGGRIDGEAYCHHPQATLQVFCPKE